MKAFNVRSILKSNVSFILIAVGALASEKAFAMMQPPGAFVPSECGLQVTPAGQPAPSRIETICVGRVVVLPGETADDRAAQFRLVDGTVETFRVQSSANPLIELPDGEHRTVYRMQAVDGSGETATLRATILRDGAVKSMTGVFEGAPYAVPETERMMVIQ